MLRLDFGGNSDRLERLRIGGARGPVRPRPSNPSSTSTLATSRTDPALIALTGEELSQVSAEGVVVDRAHDRADAVLVRALAATDADLVAVPAAELPLTDGIGALLRWADAAGRP